MQNATVVVQRLLARLRLDPHRRTIRAAADATVDRLASLVAEMTGREQFGASDRSFDLRPAARRPVRPTAAHRTGPGHAHLSGVGRALAVARPSVVRVRGSAIVVRLGGPERVLPVSVAVLVLLASILSVAPATGKPAVGNTDGPGEAPRLAIGGVSGTSGVPDGALDVAPPEADAAGGFVDLPEGVDPSDAAALEQLRARADIGDPGDLRQEQEAASADPQGPYLADGTLLKPVAVDTTVADGSDKLREYKVRSGDTLTGIAAKFGVSMMTVWWANDLTAKDDLHVGQTLVIPAVSGLVVDVKDGDTLASIAAATGASPDEIVAYNGLEDRNLIIGQTLVIPGARGEGIPTPKPRPVQSNVGARSNGGGGGGDGGSGGNGSVRPPTHYSGGSFAFPVPGGSYSQYFHYGHYGVDIAADYGASVHAAAAGTVVYAGWKGNGGGYQVWIAHGSGLYTTYNHMSAITVGIGEHVGRGEQVGRVGMSGWATGPHLHFEVWSGPVWAGGSRVNPLRYL